MRLYEGVVDTEEMVIDVNCLFYRMKGIVLVEKCSDRLTEKSDVGIVLGIFVV